MLRLFLVLGSLSPVFLLWAIRGQPKVPHWEVICLSLFALPNAVLFVALARAKRSRNEKTITVHSARDQREHLLTYLFAMLIPLYDANLSGIRDVTAVVVAFVFIVFLFWNLGLHYMNLLLAVAGYRLFTVEAKSASDKRLSAYVVITKRHHLENQKPFTGLRLGGQVLMDASDDN